MSRFCIIIKAILIKTVQSPEPRPNDRISLCPLDGYPFCTRSGETRNHHVSKHATESACACRQTPSLYTCHPERSEGSRRTAALSARRNTPNPSVRLKPDISLYQREPDVRLTNSHLKCAFRRDLSVTTLSVGASNLQPLPIKMASFWTPFPLVARIVTKSNFYKIWFKISLFPNCQA